MPERKFSLRAGEPPRIVLRWKGVWKNVEVMFDGRPIGAFEDMKALKAGAQFELPDELGSLHVRLSSGLVGTELELLRDGEPLPGSDSSPEQRVASAGAVLWVIAAINLVLGFVAMLTDLPFLAGLGVDEWTMIMGLVYGWCAFSVTRSRNKWALGVGTVLFTLDGVALFVMSLSPGAPSPVGGIVMRILFLIPLFRGLGAARALDRDARAASARG